MKEFKGDNMNITKNYDGKELTVTVEGRVETTSAKELENAIKEEIGNFDSLILDFANLEYISSAGLRVMLITQRTCTDMNVQAAGFVYSCVYGCK